jgi:hypothetical protein
MKYMPDISPIEKKLHLEEEKKIETLNGELLTSVSSFDFDSSTAL